MEFLEKDLEQIIFESNHQDLIECGLRIAGKVKRQLRIGNYGVADLVTFRKISYYDPEDNEEIPFLDITVYELKKDKVGISAFLQALNYVKGIKSYLEKRRVCNFRFNIVLVGKAIDTSGSFCYIPELVSGHDYPGGQLFDVTFYTYAMTLKGLRFKHEYGFLLTDEGFDKSNKCGF